MADKRKELKEQLSALVLDSALSEFSEKGYSGATMRNIAEKAGVSAAVIIKYFESKEGLLRTLLERYTLEGMFMYLKSDRPEDILNRYIDFIKNLQTRKPVVFQFYYKMFRDTEINKEQESFGMRYLAEEFRGSKMEKAIIRAQESDEIPKGSPEEIYLLLVYMTFEILEHYRAIGLPAPANSFILDTIQFNPSESRKYKYLEEIQELRRKNAELETFQRLIKSYCWKAPFDENGQMGEVTWSDDIVQAFGFDDGADFGSMMEMWYASVHPEDEARTLEELNAAAADKSGKTKFDTEYRVKQPNGEWRWFRDACEIFRHPDGTPDYALGTITDISDQKRNEILMKTIAAQNRQLIEGQALKKAMETARSEARTNKALYETISTRFDVMYRIDLEHGTTEFIKGDAEAEKYLKIFDATTDTGLFENFNRYYVDAVIHKADRKRVRGIMNAGNMHRQLSTGTHMSVTYRAKRNPGDYVYTEMNILREGQQDGRLTSVILAFRVVDADMRANLMRKQTLDTLSGAYLSLYYLDLNRNSFKVLKRYADHGIDVVDDSRPLDKSLAAWIKSGEVHPDDVPKMLEATSRAYMRMRFKEADVFDVQYRQIDERGEMWYEMRVVKASDYAETSGVFMGFMNRDAEIRHEREQQEALEDALRLARSASNAKSEFLFNMSHDIRTPMNAITGYTAMAKKYSKDEKVNDCLDKIDISGKHLLALINQILEMSKIESGIITLSEDPADVIDRANAIAEISSADCNSKNISSSLRIGNITHRNVLTDTARVNQIVNNIIGNAIKFTPEGGRIEYYLEEKPCDKEGYGLYVIAIKDNGIGISGEYLSHIFEEFSRERSSTVSRIEGTGLGMSIVKKLVDLMDGTIDIQSEQGKGTTVTVSLPMKWDPDAEEAADENPVSRGINLRGKRILLVEDNEMNREIATEILEDEGISVEAAEDGEIAVNIMRRAFKEGDYNRFDAILMDIQMPVMNGYEATKAIREFYSECHIPIIALSANAFDEDKRKSFESGMDDHLSKPIDIQKLKETLAKYL